MRKYKKSNDDIDIQFEDVGYLIDDPLPNPDLLEFYRRIAKREMFLNGIIDDTAFDVSMYVKKWNAEDKGKPIEERTSIKLFINSDGGDANAVMNVIDTILLSKTPVITIGMGRVYSSGGLLLMAGHKRYVFPHTSCLIHDGYSGVIGSMGKVLDTAEFNKAFEEQIKRYILSRTKITSEMYDKNYRRDWFIFADDMIKYGIADDIITDIDIIS